MTNKIKALVGIGAVLALTVGLASSVNIHGNNINADSGYQQGAAAPLNHVLLGNGTQYVDSATIPYSILTGTGTHRTCNTTGCYMIGADGTITEWFQVASLPNDNTYDSYQVPFPFTAAEQTAVCSVDRPGGNPGPIGAKAGPDLSHVYLLSNTGGTGTYMNASCIIIGY